MSNKYMDKLRKMEGAMKAKRGSRYGKVIRTPSPSTNWIFGRTHGLPLGFSALLWGPAKSGKTLISYGMTGGLHQSDKDAIVVKFDTEFRDDGQLDERSAENFGIDLERYMVFQVNKPALVFDRIRDEIGPMVQDGAPIKLIIIDSITGVMGRREVESDGVMQHNIGDVAQTTKVGLKQIVEIQKTNNIALLLTAHASVEMDPWEQKRGNKTKMAAAFGVQHHCEYFINVERNKTKSGRTDELENEMIDETRKDLTGAGQETGHKVRVWMQDSTVGQAGRVGEFTVSQEHGFVNTHEEVFRLGVGQNIITRNAMTYCVGKDRFVGKAACLEALKTNPSLQEYVIKALLEADANGTSIKTQTEILAESGPGT